MKTQIIARRKIERKIERLKQQDADAHITECIKMAQRLKIQVEKGNETVINYVINYCQ